MKRADKDLKILEHRQVAEDHFWMRLESEEIADHAEPGQFVHLKIGSGSQPLLRRPLTVYRCRPGEFEILYQVIGQGTELLSRAEPGQTVRVLGPLGNHFRLPDPQSTALVVGGGVGIASLMLLVEQLIQRQTPVEVLVGAQCAARLVAVEDLKVLGADVHVSTDDGSQGHAGFVTELADQWLQTGLSDPVVFGCGPTPMMQALSVVTQRHHVPTQLALESYMGCALGVCLGCVVDVKDSEGIPQRVRVCTEGPVFDAEEIVW